MTAARKDFQAAYVDALAGADIALMSYPYYSDRLAPENRLNRDQMISSLKKLGVHAIMPDEGEDPVETLAPFLRSGDIVVGCSSGNFGAFHRRLLERLGQKEDR